MKLTSRINKDVADFDSPVSTPGKKQRKSLPKMQPLPGTVHTQMVRCGREGCRCAQGKLHGPYYYRFYWEGGRLRKVYVKRADVESVKAQCDAGRLQSIMERRRRQQAGKRGREQFRRLTKILRELKACEGDTE